MMRTTLTLESDVAAAIEQRRRKLGHSLKQEVNELLRAGLLHAEEDKPKRPRFVVEPLDVGELLMPIDDVAGALEAAEGPWHK